MCWRPPLAIFVLVASACVAANSTVENDVTGVSASPPVSTTVNVENKPGGDRAVATSSVRDDLEEPPPIELLFEAGDRLGERIDELALFGYRGRPLATTEQALVPDVGDRYPEFLVRERSLVWGVDSGAILVTADGDPEKIKEAAAWLGQSTTWILADDGWLAAYYPSGLVDVSEMRALVEATMWIMVPEEACVRSKQACPFGSVVGYPPPPPTLLTNFEAEDTTAPFSFITIAGASDIASAGGVVSWIQNGQAYSVTGGGDGLDAGLSHGDALTSVGFGNLMFLVDPVASSRGGPAVVARPCCGQGDQAVWPVPDGWEIDGLAVVGHFGQRNYRLVVTATLADGTGHAVAVDFGDDLFAGSAGSAELDLQALSPIHPIGTGWSQPRRTVGGVLMVVEEREDGWYLIDDALGEPIELAKSSEQILSHTASAGNRNVALVSTNGIATRLWWGHDGVLTELKSEATSVAWYGSWLR